MSNLVVDIDNEVQKYISEKDKKIINIYDLFNTFGVDLHFLLKEKRYNNNFIKNIENGNYITSKTF